MPGMRKAEADCVRRDRATKLAVSEIIGLLAAWFVYNMPTSETSPVGQLGAAVVERETGSIERQVVEDAIEAVRDRQSQRLEDGCLRPRWDRLGRL